jgi:hypothetical protein
MMMNEKVKKWKKAKIRPPSFGLLFKKQSKT